jgi:hypothetical protein
MRAGDQQHILLVVGIVLQSQTVLLFPLHTGDYYGTLGGKIPYVSGTSEAKKKKGDVRGQPKNIVTGPSKKGGLGYNKTTLSERQGAAGVAGEYQYIADPIQQATRQPAAGAAPAPFKPVSPARRGGPGTVTRNFAGRATGAVGEFEWRPTPEQPQASAAATAARTAAVIAPAFRPVSVPHKGPFATFNQFPGKVIDILFSTARCNPHPSAKIALPSADNFRNK